jgi:hypothetical protein
LWRRCCAPTTTTTSITANRPGWQRGVLQADRRGRKRFLLFLTTPPHHIHRAVLPFTSRMDAPSTGYVRYEEDADADCGPRFSQNQSWGLVQTELVPKALIRGPQRQSLTASATARNRARWPREDLPLADRHQKAQTQEALNLIQVESHSDVLRHHSGGKSKIRTWVGLYRRIYSPRHSRPTHPVAAPEHCWRHGSGKRDETKLPWRVRPRRGSRAADTRSRAAQRINSRIELANIVKPPQTLHAWVGYT